MFSRKCIMPCALAPKESSMETSAFSMQAVSCHIVSVERQAAEVAVLVLQVKGMLRELRRECRAHSTV